MLRILLFLGTNIAVIALASVTLSILGFEGFLKNNGVDLDLGALLVFAAVFGFGGSLVSLFLSKTIAKMTTRTHVIEQPQNASERWLVENVRQLADRAGIGMPDVGIFPASQPNAFATGWNKNSSLVAVSTGLLEHMDEREVRAVLAHEIGHVANGDMVTLALVQGVVNTFVIFAARVVGFLVDRVVFKTERGVGPGFYIVSIVAEIILGILASMIVMWFSRYREFRADHAGAQLTSNRDMAAALERLKVSSQMPDAMPDSMQAFGINQGLRSGIAKLFSSHPPLDERIARLKSSEVA